MERDIQISGKAMRFVQLHVKAKRAKSLPDTKSVFSNVFGCGVRHRNRLERVDFTGSQTLLKGEAFVWS